MSEESFATALRRWREARELSIRDLARRAHCSRTYVSELERGLCPPPQPGVASALDDALAAGDELVTLAKQARHQQEPSSTGAGPAAILLSSTEGDIDDLLRRTLIMLGLGGTVGLGSAVPALALEAVRHGLTTSMIEERAHTTLDEWRDIVLEYGSAYLTRSPRELLDSLIVDVLGVQHAMSRSHDQATRQELQRAAGLLAAFTAMTVANLGRTHEARRWWHTARRVADESGDLETSLWVRGREIVRALYEQRPLPAVLKLTEQAESRMTSGAAPSAMPELFAGKAQSLALAGRRHEALAALEQVRDSFADLPADTAHDRESVFGWAEQKLRYTESFVFSHLGEFEQADEAQRRALVLYPTSCQRDLAQIELMRALCLVRCGDMTSGTRHALDTMDRLPRRHHVRPVIDLGYKVLHAVPRDQRQLGGVQELGEYLGRREE
jgi:transcriptional regulator with XRE-family HTH domain